MPMYNEFINEDYTELLKQSLAEMREEEAPIKHLFCDHCGSVEDIIAYDFKVTKASVRYLCFGCRSDILEWI